MSKKDTAITYIGLALLIAIGGIVLYGKKNVDPQPSNIITAPLVKGPTAPPPGYKN